MSKWRKKCTLLINMLLIPALLLSGCGKPADKKQETKITDWPEEVSYCYKSTGIAFSGDRELYVEDGIMHIRDMESDTATVLCTRSNCTHSSHSATEGASQCEATAPSDAFTDFELVALHGDTVFQFWQTEDNILHDTQLYVSHIGKSGRKKAATLPYLLNRSTSFLYFEKNKAYFIAEQNEQNEDGTQITETRCILLEMNLDTYEVTELDECISNDFIQAGKLDYSDGVLAYEIVEQEGDTYFTKVHLYDVRTKEKKVLDSYQFYDTGSCTGYIGYRDGCIYYIPETRDKIIKGEVDSGEETDIVTLDEGTVLYDCCMNYNTEIKYETADADTVDINDWDSDDKRMYHYSFEDGKIYSVQQKYTKQAGMLGVLTKDTAYYLGENGDKLEIRRIPLKEYLNYQKSKKKLVWINSEQCPKGIIDALNDELSEAGCEYSIEYQYEDGYAKNYHDRLVRMKQENKQVDLLNVGGTDMASNANMYQDAVDKELLIPIEEFLEKDERGKKIYATYHEKQWDALEIGGHIYSYDWRYQPVSDLYAYINKKYADEWKLDVNHCKLDELFEVAEKLQKEKQEEENYSFYPVIWADMPRPDNYWDDKELMEHFDKWEKVITYQEDLDCQENTDFFMYVSEEYITECSDTQILMPVTGIPCDVYKYALVKDEFFPVTSNLTGVASWSENSELALDFLYRVHTNETIANLLQYGIEGENYEMKDGRVVINYDNPALGFFGIQNKWITLPQGLEPEGKAKEKAYKEYIRKHLE